MADLSAIKTAVSSLDAKVTAHLDADGQAVLEMTAKVQALQAEVDAVAAQADAIGNRL